MYMLPGIYPAVVDLNEGTVSSGGRLYLKPRIRVYSTRTPHHKPTPYQSLRRADTTKHGSPCRLQIFPIIWVMTRCLTQLNTQVSPGNAWYHMLIRKFLQPGVLPHVVTYPAPQVTWTSHVFEDAPTTCST